MLVSLKPDADFSWWYEGTRIGNLLFATHPLPLDSRIDSEIILCPAINFRREKLALAG
jgi:hypothetical protein